MKTICFILVTMYKGSHPSLINVNNIVEIHDTKQEFTIVTTRKNFTRVKESVFEINQQIKECK